MVAQKRNRDIVLEVLQENLQKNPGEFMPTWKLLERLYDGRAMPDEPEAVLRVVIHWLRKTGHDIESKWGKGYRLIA